MLNQPRFLITNCVPLNGGDEALLRAAVESLHRRFPGASFTVLCKNLPLCRQYLPDLNLAADLEFCETPDERAATLSAYHDADIVLSAPGGFFHDHYAIEARLVGLEAALNLGKPVILFGQSIGPFWKPDSISRIREVFNRLDRICVRDQISLDHLRACGVDSARVSLTADVAFLWRDLAPDLFTPKSTPIRNIGICIRAWPLKDQVSIAQTVQKTVALCAHLLQDPSCALTLISTCQGIPGYWDDSKLSREVVASLPREFAARCHVDDIRRPPRELIRALGSLDAFIGMRLHGCLLAMLAGTPAMGLAYEPKTPEIFTQMGLENYQLPFSASARDWIAKADDFLKSAQPIRAALPTKLDERARQANINIEEVARCLSRPVASSAA
jgi:colanic acid/amylovoran biosynthesis protein